MKYDDSGVNYTNNVLYHRNKECIHKINFKKVIKITRNELHFVSEIFWQNIHDNSYSDYFLKKLFYKKEQKSF